MDTDRDSVCKKDKKKKLDEVPTKFPPNHSPNSRDQNASTGSAARPQSITTQTATRPSLNCATSLQAKKSSNFTPKQPGIFDFKLTPNNPKQAQQKHPHVPSAKPPTKVTLFDIVLTSTTDKSQSLSAAASKSVMVTPKLQDELKPKSYNANKKKKNAATSTVKKRILMERLLKYQATLDIQSNLTSTNSSSNLNNSYNTANIQNYRALYVYDFYHEAEIADENERKEILTNLSDLLIPIGPTCSVYYGTSKLNAATTDVTIHNDCIIAEFPTFKSALSAYTSLQGMIFRGERIRTSLRDISDPNRSFISPSSSETISVSSSRDSTFASSAASWCLYLENLVFEEEVNAPEECEEVLTDIKTLCKEYSSITSLWLEKRLLIDPTERDFTRPIGDHAIYSYKTTKIINSNNHISSGTCSGLPWLFVEFTDIQLAIAAVHKLSGRHLNGSKILAYLYDFSAYLSNDFCDMFTHDVFTTAQKRKSMAVATKANPSSPQRRKSVAGRRPSVMLFPTKSHQPLEDGSISAEKRVFGILLHEFVERDQVMNDGDRDDIILEINRICFQSGSALFTENQTLLQSENNEITFWKSASDSESDLLDVVVTFSTLDECCAAVLRLSGQVISGSSVKVDVISLPVKQSHWHKASPIGNGLQLHVIHRGEASGGVVLVKDYITESALTSTEELERLKQDLLVCLRDQLKFDQNTLDCSSGTVTRVSIHASNATSNHITSNNRGINIVACVGFANGDEAEKAMLHLDGGEMSGNVLHAYIGKPIIAPKNSSLSLSEELPTVSGPTDFFPAQLELSPRTPDTPIKPFPHDSDSIRQMASQRSNSMDITMISQTNSTRPSFATSSIDDGILSLDKRKSNLATSTYTEAKAAPMLVMHATTPKSIPKASEELNLEIESMLKSLEELQNRAEQKDPIKAKQKLRYIVGLKQVGNGVKSGRAKLVLLAPDIEASSALFNQIISGVFSKEIPVLYCLSRRKLGKSVGMSTKQSAIAVFDPSGVHDTFIKVSSFVHSYHENLRVEDAKNLSIASSVVPELTAGESECSRSPVIQALSLASIQQELPSTTVFSPMKSLIVAQGLASPVTLKSIDSRSMSEISIQSPSFRPGRRSKSRNSINSFIDEGQERVSDINTATQVQKDLLSERQLQSPISNRGQLSFRESPCETGISSKSRRASLGSMKGINSIGGYGPLLSGTTVVIDNGSFFMRNGFSGDDIPRSIFQTAVASVPSVEGIGYRVGKKALQCDDHRRPYEDGQIFGWEDMEAIWEHSFSDCLRVETSNTRVFLTETHMPTRATRETTVETMFELFEVEATYLHVQPVLALFAAGLTTGCVIDSGEFSTTVYPIADGYHLTNASLKLNFGGSHISDILECLMVNSGVYSEDVQNILCDPIGNVVREIKEAFADVSVQANNWGSTQKDALNYTLPDGTSINLNSTNALTECTERFFDPFRFAHIVDADEDGLHNAIVKSVMSVGLDLRRNLMSSIVLTGGNTMFGGLKDRLTSELKCVVPASMVSSMRVLAPNDRHNAIWVGGSILTSLSTFEDMWITSADYDECGATIVHEKCSVYL